MTVSCIMLASPGRERLREMAIRCYLNQTYPDKQLIVVDGSTGESIGTLRNKACAAASGDLIAHWDDDDWSSPTRIEDQVSFLEVNNLQVSGFYDMPFFDLASRQAYLYQSNDPKYCVGTSLLYRRSYWQRHPFPDKMRGEDNGFVYGCEKPLRGAMQCEGRMVATCHGANTTNKQPKFCLWLPNPEIPTEFFTDASESGLL